MRATEKTPKECKSTQPLLYKINKHSSIIQQLYIAMYNQSSFAFVDSTPQVSLFTPNRFQFLRRKNEISQLRLARHPLSPITRARDLVQANERLTRSQRKPSFVFPIHGSRSTTVSYAVVDRGRIVPNKRPLSLLRRSETPDPKNFFLARMRPRHANTSLNFSRRRKNRRAN